MNAHFILFLFYFVGVYIIYNIIRLLAIMIISYIPSPSQQKKKSYDEIMMKPMR